MGNDAMAIANALSSALLGWQMGRERKRERERDKEVFDLKKALLELKKEGAISERDYHEWSREWDKKDRERQEAVYQGLGGVGGEIQRGQEAYETTRQRSQLEMDNIRGQINDRLAGRQLERDKFAYGKQQDATQAARAEQADRLKNDTFRAQQLDQLASQLLKAGQYVEAQQATDLLNRYDPGTGFSDEDQLAVRRMLAVRVGEGEGGGVSPSVLLAQQAARKEKETEGEAERKELWAETGDWLNLLYGKAENLINQIDETEDPAQKQQLLNALANVQRQIDMAEQERGRYGKTGVAESMAGMYGGRGEAEGDTGDATAPQEQGPLGKLLAPQTAQSIRPDWAKDVWRGARPQMNLMHPLTDQGPALNQFYLETEIPPEVLAHAKQSRWFAPEREAARIQSLVGEGYSAQEAQKIADGELLDYTMMNEGVGDVATTTLGMMAFQGPLKKAAGGLGRLLGKSETLKPLGSALQWAGQDVGRAGAPIAMKGLGQARNLLPGPGRVIPMGAPPGPASPAMPAPRALPPGSIPRALPPGAIPRSLPAPPGYVPSTVMSSGPAIPMEGLNLPSAPTVSLPYGYGPRAGGPQIPLDKETVLRMLIGAQ